MICSGLGGRTVLWHVCCVNRPLHWDCDLIHPFARRPVWKRSLCCRGTSAREWDGNMVVKMGAPGRAAYFGRQNDWDAASKQMVLIYEDGASTAEAEKLT